MVPRNRKIDFLGIVLVAGLALSSGPAFAAEQRSADDIINALKSPRVTRGLTTSPADAARAADETRFLSAVRNRPTRSLSTEERDKIASIASSKPKIDLEINFEFNSAVHWVEGNASGYGTRKGAHERGPEGAHLHTCWFHGCQRQRNLQSGSVGTARGCCKAVPITENTGLSRAI